MCIYLAYIDQNRVNKTYHFRAYILACCDNETEHYKWPGIITLKMAFLLAPV